MNKMWRKILLLLAVTACAGLWGCSSGDSGGGSAFGPATAIQQGNSDAQDPAVAMNSLGDGIAVWAQDDGSGNYRIWANHYQPSRWLGPQRIQDDAVEGLSPRVALDDGGNAILVWLRFDSPDVYHLWSRRYVAATKTWGAARLIQSGGDSQDPQLSADPFGNAVVVWTQDDGTGRYVVRASRYNAAADAWELNQALETSAGESLFPMVKIDAAGNALAIWMQADGSGIYDIRFSRLSAAALSWGNPGFVETDTGDAANPILAVLPDGGAFAVWQQDNGLTNNQQDEGSGNYRVMANYLPSGANWQGSVDIQGGTAASGLNPYVAVDASGNVLALWREDDGSGQYAVRSSRVGAGATSWTSPSAVMLTTDELFSLGLGMDAAGNAAAVWLQAAAGGNTVVHGSTAYAASPTWSAAAAIPSSTDGAAQPAVAVSGRQLLAVWLQDDGTGSGVRRIMASRGHF